MDKDTSSQACTERSSEGAVAAWLANSDSGRAFLPRAARVKQQMSRAVSTVMCAQQSARQADVGHHRLAGPHQAPRPREAPLPKAAGARLGALLGPAMNPAVLRSHNHAHGQPVWPCQAQPGCSLCVVSLLLLFCSLGFLFNCVQIGLPSPSQQAGTTSARGGTLPAGGQGSVPQQWVASSCGSGASRQPQQCCAAYSCRMMEGVTTGRASADCLVKMHGSNLNSRI